MQADKMDQLILEILFGRKAGNDSVHRKEERNN